MKLKQLELELGSIRRNYKPLKGANCPCCRQNVTQEQILVSWRELREWLYANWDWAAKYLVSHQVHNPRQLSLTEHPDLLWALEAEAGDQELEISDMLAEILDGYFQGATDALKRRGKKLVLKPKPKDPRKQKQKNASEDDQAKQSPIDLNPYAWRDGYFMAALPAGQLAETMVLLFQYSDTETQTRPEMVLGEMVVLSQPYPIPDRVRLATF